MEQSASHEAEADQDPRLRIMESAITLFARKGYSATGVREIAANAGANPAMINYYYSSKLNILQMIFESFFDSVTEAFEEVLVDESSVEDRLRVYIKRLIEILRQDPRKTRIVFSELSLDVVEMAEFKARAIREKIMPMVEQMIGDTSIDSSIAGPAIVGMVSYHFMSLPVYKQVTGVTPDEEFYRTFSDKLSDLLLFGLVGKAP